MILLQRWMKVLAATGLALLLAAPALALEIHGHRGARGLAPENTLASFEVALREGATALELDVFLTADQVLVVHHDSALNPDLTRGPDGQWLQATGPLLKTLTFAQLQGYDLGRLKEGSNTARNFPQQRPADGQKAPTLAAVFELLKARGGPDTRVNIEIKHSPYAPQDYAEVDALVKATLAEVDRAGLRRRVMIQAFNWAVMQRAQQLAPDIPTGYLTLARGRGPNVNDPRWMAGRVLAEHGGSVPRMVKAAGGTYWTPNHNDLTAEAVKEAQALGLKVVPWTVNEVAEMQKLIGWGVDGLITDYPDRVRAARK